MKILIVDDEAIVVESCRRILEAEGMSVRIAENALSARQLLDVEKDFDLMLTDIKMPRQDGFHLIRHVRDRFPEVAVLMMTGYLTPETVGRGEQEGAHGFIAKPFTPEELVDAVHKTLENH